uniref:Uncharacterized protein n=1 Tax=Anguilla anguilla TaxID=7936 RepID=A0A0E9PIZ8_ANGAN
MNQQVPGHTGQKSGSSASKIKTGCKWIFQQENETVKWAAKPLFEMVISSFQKTDTKIL